MDLLEQTAAPVYMVSGHGEILLANDALCEWVNLPVESVVGREVQYHSEPDGAGHAAPLSGLCPPPDAFTSDERRGTLSTIGRDGKLRHRKARFVALPPADPDARPAVIAIAEMRDLTAGQLAAEVSDEPTHDQLHRDIRRFRRELDQPEATALLLGASPTARRLRAQHEMAVKAGSGALVVGPCSADTLVIAKAIHYGKRDVSAPLVPIDCERLDAEEAVRAITLARPESSPTYLLIEPAAASQEFQQAIAGALSAAPARVLLTHRLDRDACLPELLTLAGPVRMDVPPLAERADDLPMIVQYFVERANEGAVRQVSGASQEVLDRLAVYGWPQGVSQLAGVIAEACAACQGDELTQGDLPVVMRHAVSAASLGAAKPTPIVLDELLKEIEREVVSRALSQAKDNKAEAARLLGLTRQRLYRRLETLGLLDGTSEARDG